MRDEQEACRAIERYADTVKRLCIIHLKNGPDAEDLFQNVFLKYVLSSIVFESEEHEKAWVIRVTINECKDLLKSFFRSRTVPLEEAPDLPAQDPAGGREVLGAVLSLPQRYRDVIYLHYYESYSAVEIGKLLSKNVNSIYTLLHRAKALLREDLGGDELE